MAIIVEMSMAEQMGAWAAEKVGAILVSGLKDAKHHLFVISQSRRSDQWDALLASLLFDNRDCA
jgi:hypothetical protein